jgi:hypothetical protein
MRTTRSTHHLLVQMGWLYRKFASSDFNMNSAIIKQSARHKCLRLLICQYNLKDVYRHAGRWLLLPFPFGRLQIETQKENIIFDVVWRLLQDYQVAIEAKYFGTACLVWGFHSTDTVYEVYTVKSAVVWRVTPCSFVPNSSRKRLTLKIGVGPSSNHHNLSTKLHGVAFREIDFTFIAAWESHISQRVINLVDLVFWKEQFSLALFLLQ